ncbi:DUF1905 domain-containing protein [Fusibacter bizertensis]
MTKLYFESILLGIDHHKILHFPKEISVQLPSRGMVMVEGFIEFRAALEPDGMGSHWFELDEKLTKDAAISSGDPVKLVIQDTDNWYEPDVPKDL